MSVIRLNILGVITTYSYLLYVTEYYNRVISLNKSKHSQFRLKCKPSSVLFKREVLFKSKQSGTKK